MHKESNETNEIASSIEQARKLQGMRERDRDKESETDTRQWHAITSTVPQHICMSLVISIYCFGTGTFIVGVLSFTYLLHAYAVVAPYNIFTS